MSKTSEVDSIELSARDLGTVLGLTDRQVRNLADDGIIIRGEARGRFKLHPSAANYVKHVGSRETPASVRLDEERARGQRLTNDIREGKLIPLEVADAHLQEILGVILTGISGLPVMIVGNRKDRDKIQHIETVIDRMKVGMVTSIQKLQTGFQEDLDKRTVRRA